jgi:hypothetical protein
MNKFPVFLLLVALTTAIAGCSKRTPDFTKLARSPTGGTIARFAGYEPRGTIGGVLTLTFQRRKEVAPQITLGHLMQLRAGWLDDHNFALVYDTLELHKLTSPVYPTGETDSKIRIVTCNLKYVDCAPILQRLTPDHSVDIAQFPGGDWPTFKEYRDY